MICDDKIESQLGTVSTVATLTSIVATIGKNFIPIKDIQNLVDSVVAHGGLVSNMALLTRKIHNGTAGFKDYVTVAHDIADVVVSFVQLATKKSLVGMTVSILWDLTQLLAPNKPCVFPEKETPDIKPAQDVKSPLAIDLDGDGIATYALKNGVFFDIDADGFAEKTAWLNAKDAFLAIDRNKNGVIDNATELFGDLTAANGFEALKALDSNGDGIIDANDIAWEQLLLWQDAINDGVSQENELITAADAGIAYIELNYQNQDVTDENGNEHRQTATVHWQDGHTTVIEDIWFQTNQAQSIDLTGLNVSDEEWAELAELPYIDAFGVIADCFNDRIISNDDYFFQAA